MQKFAPSTNRIRGEVLQIQRPFASRTLDARLLARPIQPRLLRLKVAVNKAEDDSSNEASQPRKSGFKNPFPMKNKKQDEAQRALQEMFKGKKDSLSMYDPAPPGNGGSGGKGGGSGGFFASWRAFDWRDWGEQRVGSFFASMKGMGQVIAAVLLIGFILVLVSLGPSVIGLSLSLVRRVLGLGGSGRSRPQLGSPQGHHHHHQHAHDLLGPHERYVMSKFGADAGDSRAAKTQGSSEGPTGAMA